MSYNVTSQCIINALNFKVLVRVSSKIKNTINFNVLLGVSCRDSHFGPAPLLVGKLVTHRTACCTMKDWRTVVRCDATGVTIVMYTGDVTWDLEGGHQQR